MKTLNRTNVENLKNEILSEINKNGFYNRTAPTGIRNDYRIEERELKRAIYELEMMDNKIECIGILAP